MRSHYQCASRFLDRRAMLLMSGSTKQSVVMNGGSGITVAWVGDMS